MRVFVLRIHSLRVFFETISSCLSLKDGQPRVPRGASPPNHPQYRILLLAIALICRPCQPSEFIRAALCKVLTLQKASQIRSDFV